MLHNEVFNVYCKHDTIALQSQIPHDLTFVLYTTSCILETPVPGKHFQISNKPVGPVYFTTQAFDFCPHVSRTSRGTSSSTSSRLAGN